MANPTTSPIFSFQNHPIRTNIRNGQIWFVARDVCKVLGLRWTGTSLAGIHADWQGLWSDHNLKSNQRFKFINEPAVYKLAFRSNKPQADAFTNWVASEVLPAIRKTGKYEASAQTQEKVLPPPAPSLKEEWLQAYAEYTRAEKATSASYDTFVKTTSNVLYDSLYPGKIEKQYDAIKVLENLLRIRYFIESSISSALAAADKIVEG